MTEPTEYPVDIPVTQKMQDRMRAAGWRPPALVLRTREDIAAHPFAVFADMDSRHAFVGFVSEYLPSPDDWTEDGVPGACGSLPITVLWEPSE